MNLSISSWNAQGNSIEKLTEVHRLFHSSRHKNIILIQEAGVFETEKYNVCEFRKIMGGKYYGYFVPAVNAKNERCTTGILIETSICTTPPDFHTFDSGKTRPVVYANIQGDNINFNIATVHAIAQHSVAKKEILKIFQTLGSVGPNWLLMGDFNCNPEELIEIGVPRENLQRSGRLTQQSGNELDYAIFSPNFIGAINLVRGCPGDPIYVPSRSDHIPVYVQLDV